MRVVIALPALNEEKVIESTVRALRRFADAELGGHSVTVCVVDNGSTDGTEVICRRLAGELADIRYLQLSQKGKGLAIREGWSSVEADAYVFMDADLAVDLAALPPLVRAIESGAGLAVGSRYHADSVVQRSVLRKLLSRGYRTLVGVLLETRITDIPCGFKAASAEVVRTIVPRIKDNRWFFDTELVIRTERSGLRVDEVPVTWRELLPEGRVSRVRVLPLMKEYLSRVVALRRELGPSTSPARTESLHDLARSITKNERIFVAVAAAVVAVLGLIAPALGNYNAQRFGLEWTGRQFLAPGDFAVYLSYIAQAKEGHFLLANLATNEQLIPVFNVLWLPIGWLARLFALTPLAAYHVARTLLILPFAAVAYAFISYVFRGLRERVVAFGLLMFGSGLGLYAAPLLRGLRAAPEDWPIDFWVAEANVLMTLIYSPHFIASFGLIIGIALLLFMALDAESPSYGAWAGVLGLVLFNFHPFHAPTLYALAIAALFAATYRKGFRIRQWQAVALFGLLSVPSVAYHYWLTHWTVNAAAMLENNVTTTPHFPFVAIGMGMILPLAVIGWWNETRGKTSHMTESHRDYLSVWVVSQLCLVYAPFIFQRRLIEGWQVPLTLLATVACISIARLRVFRRAFAPAIGILVAAALLLPSSFSTVARSVEAANPKAKKAEYFFFPKERTEMLAWVRLQTPENAVLLSGMQTGNDIMGWAHRTSYAGHWSNTVDIGRKLTEIQRFYGPMAPEERRSFARSRGITLIVVGPEERQRGENPCATDLFLKKFQNEAYEICAANEVDGSTLSL